MKKITIPIEFGQPVVSAWINDKKYVLETGKEIEVDDHVADFMAAAINSSEPVKVKTVPPFMAFYDLDLEIGDFFEDSSGRPLRGMAFTNMEQIRDALDNNAVIRILSTYTGSGVLYYKEYRYDLHKAVRRLFTESDGTPYYQIQNGGGAGLSAEDLIITLDRDEYDKGNIIPTSAKRRGADGIARAYVAPF